MKLVLDTNVLISGFFFGGLPKTILNRCLDGEFKLVLSQAVFEEYKAIFQRIGEGKNLDKEIDTFLNYLASNNSWVEPVTLDKQVCEDADDDMFIATALAAKAKVIVSGDKLLLKVKQYRSVNILTPKDFLDQF